MEQEVVACYDRALQATDDPAFTLGETAGVLRALAILQSTLGLPQSAVYLQYTQAVRQSRAEDLSSG